MKLTYELNDELCQDLINIETKLFAPLGGFMTSHDYHSSVENMCLSSGEVWTIPISLDVDHDTFLKAVDSDVIWLHYRGKEIGYLKIEDCFKVDLQSDAVKVFKTGDKVHPGVNKELSRHEFRIGGKTVVTDESILLGALNPANTKKFFLEKGWKTVAGFQTRNPVHKAHEHSQRVALEICDGLFINPLVGWKKAGDFSEAAVTLGYEAMIKHYYANVNVHMDMLKTAMRYAGPREAIFHAIVRRNLGCTHFIIGRDHAGVGDYYGLYEAHELAKKITKQADLGIELLLLNGPFYCGKCEQIVTSRTCGHGEEYTESISGTMIREMLAKGERPDERFMRAEIADAIIALGDQKFIQEQV